MSLSIRKFLVLAVLEGYFWLGSPKLNFQLSEKLYRHDSWIPCGHCKVVWREMWQERNCYQDTVWINDFFPHCRMHFIVHVLTWYFIFEWSFFSTNIGVNSILLAWLCFLKYKTLQHSGEVLGNLCRHSKYLFLAPILITWLILSNYEIHEHVSCVTFKWFLFQESDNELLRRDVEFSITTLKTCELVSSTILKVSHKKCY